MLDYYVVLPESYWVQFWTTPHLPESFFKMFAHKLSLVCAYLFRDA